MERALRTSSFLTAAITVLAVVMLVAGLVVSARPEIGASVGLSLAPRDGLAIALASGAIAIASALLGHVLNLLAN